MSARAAFFATVAPTAAMSLGQAFLQQASWAVIGDVLNPAKPAAQVVASLKREGKTVHLINPRDKTATCHATLNDVGAPIDVVDLCINHIEGLKQVEMMGGLGIKKVFIQPGAASPEILAKCVDDGIEVFQGCVMVELGHH